ncbi:MAG TPA: hypothetical protein VM925_13915 [Labilithrix sp.]|nr:hypothetical protein [Labilithrix sp.]
MGPFEARHASLVGASTNMPMDGSAVDGAPGQERGPSSPLWMDASAPHVGRRRGAIPAPRSGLHTALFFGLIITAVTAAGIFGVAVWGPEKTVKNRTQFASNPQPPPELPGLGTTTPAAPLPVIVETAAESAPAAADSPAPAPSASAVKKGKRAPKAVGKKGR